MFKNWLRRARTRPQSPPDRAIAAEMERVFIAAENEKLVAIYNRLAERKPGKKYLHGAIMLRAAISAFDIAVKDFS